MQEGGGLSSVQEATHCPTPPNVSRYTSDGKIRLHGIEYSIQLNHPLSKAYQHQTINIKGNLIKTFYNSILIWQDKDTFFYGESPERAYTKSIAYFTWLFETLEKKLQYYFYTKNQSTIKEVAHHYERFNDEHGCWNYMQGTKRHQIKSTEDGVVWFETDRSLKGTNSETKHPMTAKEDMQWYDKDMNAMRDGNALTHLQLTDTMQQLTANVNKLAVMQEKGIAQMNAEIRTHLALLRQEIKDFKKNPKKRKDTQQGLGKWL
jgi:hypothetical protein